MAIVGGIECMFLSDCSCALRIARSAKSSGSVFYIMDLFVKGYTYFVTAAVLISMLAVLFSAESHIRSYCSFR